MAVKQRGLSISLVLILLLGVFSSPVAASELSDAEQRYTELRRSYDLNLEAINFLYPGWEAGARECINRLSSAASSEDVSTREGCQIALSRFQATKSSLVSQNEDLKAEISALEMRIQTLRGSTQSSGSASSSSGGSSASNKQSSSPTASSSTQTSDTQSSQSTSDNSATVSPAPTPTPAQNSESQVAISAPTPTSSPSPSAVSGSKVSATPKPVVKKKKTITCVKGKVTRKITAVKPVCPKGFKVKKK